MRPLVSIITINYNSKNDTIEFLDEIAKSQKDSDLHFEVIVVDNHSKEDPFLSSDAAAYPFVRVVQTEKNLGFAGGNNFGILASAGKYVFLVNNDAILKLYELEKLIAYYERNPEYGILCPVIKNIDGSIQFAGYTKINSLTGRNKLLTVVSEEDCIMSTAYPHGAAMLISRNNLDKIGMMSENYFLYYEEVDWGQRIRKIGLSIGVATDCEVIHKESASTGKLSDCKLYFITRNRILFVRKNFGLKQRMIFLVFFMLISTPKNLFSFLIRKEFSSIQTYIAAIHWHLKNDASSEILGYKFNSLI